MDYIFNSRAFISDLAKELVYDFNRATNATTPSLKGAARENAVRKKLENLLPAGVGIGTGCVINHEGKASRQQDIVLYEKDICPVFSVNDTPESTYFPCEGVIAVGEIKTSLGKSEIEDSFLKIASVKSLKRFAIESVSGLTSRKYFSYRKYGTRLGFDCAPSEDFNQSENQFDQIFGFVLCGDFSVSEETICSHVVNQLKIQNLAHCPNLIVSLSRGMFSPYDKNLNQLHYSMLKTKSMLYGTCVSGNFEYLLVKLHEAIVKGRTCDVNAFFKYLINNAEAMSIAVNRVIERDGEIIS